MIIHVNNCNIIKKGWDQLNNCNIIKKGWDQPLRWWLCRNDTSNREY